MSGFMEKNLPDYQVKLWDCTAFDVSSTAWTRQAYEHKRYELVSDYIRFYALYQEGGIYLDSDAEVLKSFDSLLKYRFFWGYEYTGIPEAAVIGAQKGLKWIKNCLDWYESNVPYDEKGKLHMTVCPSILQYGFTKEYGVRLIDHGKITKKDGGLIFPSCYFSPKNGFSGNIGDISRAYTIHHFNSFWLTDSISIKIRKKMHLLFIRCFGKYRYNQIMYRIRKKIHKT